MDKWAEWLVRTRFEGRPEEEIEEMLALLAARRDEVLDRARLRPDDTVLDVGAGTGLLVAGALERLGDEGAVIALDVSHDCLDELQRVCDDPRVWYLIGCAQVIPLPDETGDVIVTRSVLIYVPEKAEAAREFFRVLRPGGRFSIFEPVNSRNTRLTDVVDFGELHERVVEESDASRAPDDPMLDFDERDLVHHFAEAGFVELDAKLELGEQAVPVETLLTAIGAPGARSLLDRWQQSFSPAEVEQLVAALHGHGETVALSWPHLYLSGSKQ